MEGFFDVIVINGLVVTASDRSFLDIGIKDGKIHTLAASIIPSHGKQILDAQGGMVMPGGIDAHVHLSQDIETERGGSGPFSADDFETGSRSAVCGGTTTMISFAHQYRKDASILAVVEDYDARATATGSYIDYSYHCIVTNPSPAMLDEEFPILAKEKGVTSVKLFMTYRDLRLTDSQILDVMLAGRKHGITVLLHAENGDIIEWLTEKLVSQGLVAPIYHTHSRPQIVEQEAASRAIVLAELVQSPLVLVHVSAGGAARAIRDAQGRDLPVYGETCPQYIMLKHDDLTRFAPPDTFENSKHVCSPPPGPDGSDQEAIWTGLRNGTFSIFSSDHCPYKFAGARGKMLGLTPVTDDPLPPTTSAPDLLAHAKGKEGNFKYIPNGIPGVETRLPLLFCNGVEEGRISAERFVELTSTNPAKLYGMYPQKGSLLPGSDADIVIWHPRGAMEPFDLTNDRLHHNVDYTPYEGQRFTNWPRHVLVRGKLLYSNGALQESRPGWGRHQHFGLPLTSRNSDFNLKVSDLASSVLTSAEALDLSLIS